MTAAIKVGDLVLAPAGPLLPVSRPALVIRTTLGGGRVRLKVGSREWWDNPKDCKKVSE